MSKDIFDLEPPPDLVPPTEGWDLMREATREIKIVGRASLKRLARLFEVTSSDMELIYLGELNERAPGELPLIALKGGLR